MTPLLDDLYELNDHENQIANQLLQQELPHVQDFVWTGRPVQGFLFEKGSFINIFIGIVFMLSGLLAALILTVGHSVWLALLFGLVFGGVGFYLAIGSFILSRYLRRSTAYGLTTKGLHAVQGNSVVFTPLSNVAKARVHYRRSNGTGMIAHHERRGATLHIKEYTTRIPNAEAVLQLIQQLAKEAQT